MEYKKLERGFYLRDTVTVARELLGKYLVHKVNGEELIAEITETEAYTGVNDKGCHSYGGRRTARTQIMYGTGGHAYIYLIYGMYYLFNVVTEGEGNPCAVLIRQAEPVFGLDTVSRLRFGRDHAELTGPQRRGLLNGPGKLCQGMGLDKSQNGLDLTGSGLYIAEPDVQWGFFTGIGLRINIDYAGEDAALPYRFYMTKTSADDETR